MTTWVGKTVFITGASRGIGAAIAKRFAAAGANVAIAAKSMEAHPVLPGSLPETAAAVETMGGNALALYMDVRDEASIQHAVQQTVEAFGGIDVCINNAGAFWMQPSMETPAKRHDLLFAINERGCYLTTQACFPYLKKSVNPHILTIAPPIIPAVDLRPVWFQHTSPYAVSKYAMSLYTLGWAKEFAEFCIAANTLWPRTGIESPAALVHGGEELRNEFRKPSIMADAAFAIANKDSGSFSGHFCIDDSFLYEHEGVTDFEHYSVQPGAALVPDYFVPDTIPAPPGVTLSEFRLYDID